jgi:hypothetical protein
MRYEDTKTRLIGLYSNLFVLRVTYCISNRILLIPISAGFVAYKISRKHFKLLKFCVCVCVCVCGTKGRTGDKSSDNTPSA